MPRAIIVGPKTSRRATRAVGRDLVIASLVAAKGIRRANCNGRRFIARRMYATVDVFSGGGFALVAGRSDNCYAGIRDRAHRLTQRIVAVGIDCRRTDTHVYYTNAI